MEGGQELTINPNRTRRINEKRKVEEEGEESKRQQEDKVYKQKVKEVKLEKSPSPPKAHPSNQIAVASATQISENKETTSSAPPQKQEVSNTAPISLVIHNNNNSAPQPVFERGHQRQGSYNAPTPQEIEEANDLWSRPELERAYQREGLEAMVLGEKVETLEKQNKNLHGYLEEAAENFDEILQEKEELTQRVEELYQDAEVLHHTAEEILGKTWDEKQRYALELTKTEIALKETNEKLQSLTSQANEIIGKNNLEIESLKTQINNLLNELNQTKNDKELTKKERDEVQNYANRMISQLETQVRELINDSKDKGQLILDLNQEKQKNEEAQKKIQELEIIAEKKKIYSNENKQLKNEKFGREKVWELNRKKYSDELKELRPKIQEKQNEINTMNETIKHLENEVDRISKDFNAKHELNLKDVTELNNAKKEIETLNKKILELQNTPMTQDNKEKLEELEKENKTLKEQVTKLEGKQEVKSKEKNQKNQPEIKKKKSDDMDIDYDELEIRSSNSKKQKYVKEKEILKKKREKNIKKIHDYDSKLKNLSPEDAEFEKYMRLRKQTFDELKQQNKDNDDLNKHILEADKFMEQKRHDQEMERLKAKNKRKELELQHLNKLEENAQKRFQEEEIRQEKQRIEDEIRKEKQNHEIEKQKLADKRDEMNNAFKLEIKKMELANQQRGIGGGGGFGGGGFGQRPFERYPEKRKAQLEELEKKRKIEAEAKKKPSETSASKKAAQVLRDVVKNGIVNKDELKSLKEKAQKLTEPVYLRVSQGKKTISGAATIDLKSIEAKSNSMSSPKKTLEKLLKKAIEKGDLDAAQIIKLKSAVQAAAKKGKLKIQIFHAKEKPAKGILIEFKKKSK